MDGRQRTGDLTGGLILHREQVIERAIIAVRPDVIAGRGIDQLGGDADLAAVDLQAAFEDVLDAEVARDLTDIDRLALVDLGRIAGDHEQLPEP